MKARPIARRLILLCAAVASCAGVCALIAPAPENSARAVPHVISRADHPFDPDWLLVKTLLAEKCVCCHRGGTDRYDFTTYESLLAAGRSDGMPAIVPGRPNESLLWEYTCWNVSAVQLTDLPDMPQMPPKRAEWLTAGQQSVLRRWIENGALEYRLPACCHPRPLLESDFPSARQCGGCHPKQYQEWSRSMHAYGQHSPVFEAFNLTLIERTGGTIGTFCTRCHTPIGTSLGENGSRRNVHRSRLSMEGVTCVACHRRQNGFFKASGRVPIAPGGLLEGCVYGPFDGAVSAEHGSHESSAHPYIKTSQFCGECHDVTSPDGVRLEEAFSEWQNSPAARRGITCQSCHMGPVQGIPIPDCERPLGRAAEVPGIDDDRLPLRRLTDHTFAGPDYSLLPDTEFPHKLDWMYETDYRAVESLTPHQQRTLYELRLANRDSLRQADAKRYELLRNSAKISVRHPAAADTGRLVSIGVDVTSTLAGHSFPTGFTAERQAWVSVEVFDPQGTLIFASGDLDENGDLRDEHSHAVLTGHAPRDRHLLNFQNKFINLTTKGTERSVVISVNRHLQPLNVLRPAGGLSASFGRPPAFRIAKGSLPPLKTIGAAYPFRLSDCPGKYFVRVRLNYRHLPPTLLDHIGTPHLKHLLEVVVIDEYVGWIEGEG